MVSFQGGNGDPGRAAAGAALAAERVEAFAKFLFDAVECFQRRQLLFDVHFRSDIVVCLLFGLYRIYASVSIPSKKRRLPADRHFCYKKFQTPRFCLVKQTTVVEAPLVIADGLRGKSQTAVAVYGKYFSEVYRR
jgi:hypothetical protein